MSFNKKRDNEENSIFRIPPYQYIHVLDQTTNVTRVETGPKTYIRQENERFVVFHFKTIYLIGFLSAKLVMFFSFTRVLFGPEKMIIVPPQHYCIIQNPVLRNEKSEIQCDNIGQVKLQHADQEVRLSQDPFPLYPGEILFKAVTQLKIVASNSALRIRASRDFLDVSVSRIAGDEWLFEGPGKSYAYD